MRENHLESKKVFIVFAVDRFNYDAQFEGTNPGVAAYLCGVSISVRGEHGH